jgi:hypothetical protein
MSKGLIVALSILAVVLLGVGVVATSYIGAYNAGNRYENLLEGFNRNNENILAQYGQKIAEAAQVPKMQSQDLKDLFSGANAARYGADGSKAAMQWLKEQNPNLDQSTYVQLQRMIEAGRNEFTVSQTKLVDVRRQYETELGSFYRGFWLGVAGYPKKDLSKFDIVSTDRASEAFRTKKEAPLQLR